MTQSINELLAAFRATQTAPSLVTPELPAEPARDEAGWSIDPADWRVPHIKAALKSLEAQVPELKRPSKVFTPRGRETSQHFYWRIAAERCLRDRDEAAYRAIREWLS